MKKFREHFWEVLFWITLGIFILSFICLIVLVCLGYNEESSLIIYLCYTCAISGVMALIIYISTVKSILRTAPENRIIAALEELNKQFAEEETSEKPFTEFDEQPNNLHDDYDCEDCIFATTYDDMGSSTPVCTFNEDELKVRKKNGKALCPNKFTRDNAREIAMNRNNNENK